MFYDKIRELNVKSRDYKAPYCRLPVLVIKSIEMLRQKICDSLYCSGRTESGVSILLASCTISDDYGCYTV